MKYLSIFRLRFIGQLQYRGAALAGLTTQIAWGLMLMLSFAAFYRQDPAAFPMSFSQTAAYVWLQQAFLTLFMIWFYDNSIFDAVSSGEIAYELARPIDLYSLWFFRSIAARFANATLRSMPLLIIAFLVPEPYRLILPPNPLQFVLFIISLLFSVIVVVAFTMLVYISAFRTISTLGIRIIAAALSDFLAGYIIPIPFFPQPFRMIASVLPFSAMGNTPLRIYSGHIAGRDALTAVLLQIFWAVVLVITGQIYMSRATRHIVVQGG